MVGDHEIPGGLAICSLRGGHEIKRICALVQITCEVEEIVLQVATQLHVARGASVALGDATSVASDKRLLQIAHIDRSVPQGAHSHCTLLGNGNLRDVFPLKVERAVLHVARSQL